MNHLFVISSAINTKFGVFDSNQRLLQTYRTIKSVYDRVPNSKIVLIESSGIPLENEVLQKLHECVHCLIDMSGTETVSTIYNSTPNWDVVKNVCEVLCFLMAFKSIEENGMLEGIDRVHKLSGRYVLNDNFDLSAYEKYPDKIIMIDKVPTTFGSHVEIPFQYASRLWSWPISLHPLIKDFYLQTITEMRERLLVNMYADIEHLMYKFLPEEHIQTVNTIGVEGYIGGNKLFISE